MRHIKMIFVAAAMLIAPAALQAQSSRINIDIPGLAEKAKETVDVTLDAQMLKLAAKFLSNNDADQREVKGIVDKLTGLYVRSYEFDDEGDYDRAVLSRVRQQLGPTWKKIVTVTSRDRENVEVYTDVRGDAITGLVVISAEPRELTIVNIVGPIDLDRLASLEGQFGIPRVGIEKKEKDRD